MLVVSDTSPLICLIRLEKLDLLNQLFGEIIIPKAVYDEIMILETFGDDLSEFQNAKWIEIREPKNLELLNELKPLLDLGETEAITLAKELNIRFLLIDEKKGREIATKKELITIGTIGILLKAKEQKLIQKIKPELEKLRKTGFWISEKLFQKIIKIANE